MGKEGGLVRRIVFLYLGIDALWDEEALRELFPVRSSLHQRQFREYTVFGLYFARPGDRVVLCTSLDPSFAEYLDLHGIPMPDLVPVRGDPAEVGWEAAVQRDWRGTSGEYEPLFLGCSPAEEPIVKAAFPERWPEFQRSMEAHVRWNRKSLLVEWAEELGIPFPRSQVVDLRDWKDPAFPGPYLLKALLSAGGSSQLRVDGAEAPLLSLFRRRLEQKNLRSRWLAQELHSRMADYCIFGDSSAAEALGELEVFYDEQRSSWRHRFPSWRDPEHGRLLRDAFTQLGEKLRASGYRGPYGLDAFLTESGSFFPAVDLNVRMDKSRLIHEAARRFGLAPQETDSHRVRFRTDGEESFGSVWKRVRKELGLDPTGRGAEGFLFPYLFCRAAPDDGMLAELSYFCGVPGAAADSGAARSWAERTRSLWPPQG